MRTIPKPCICSFATSTTKRLEIFRSNSEGKNLVNLIKFHGSMGKDVENLPRIRVITISKIRNLSLWRIRVVDCEAKVGIYEIQSVAAPLPFLTESAASMKIHLSREIWIPQTHRFHIIPSDKEHQLETIAFI